MEAPWPSSFSAATGSSPSRRGGAYFRAPSRFSLTANTPFIHHPRSPVFPRRRIHSYRHLRRPFARPGLAEKDMPERAERHVHCGPIVWVLGEIGWRLLVEPSKESVDLHYINILPS